MALGDRLLARWGFVTEAAGTSQTVAAMAVETAAKFSTPTASPWTDGGVYIGTNASRTIAQRISREEALQVPAVQRARNLIAGTISGLPLVTIDSNRRKVRVPLFEQLDPNVANVVTMAHTVEDLIFEATSWWRIIQFGRDEYPMRIERIDPKRVSVKEGRVYIDNIYVEDSKLIRFDSPNPAVLTYAARAIRRALKFEQAAELYSNAPKAMGYFTPSDLDAEPGEEDVTNLLDDWEDARWNHSTAYIPFSLRWNPVSMMSAVDLQLVQLQERAALDVANCTGLDPRDVGVAVNDRTYNNAQDRRQDRLNETLQPYLRAVSDRLSMGDVTKRGQRVVFDLDDFMRADPSTRANVYQIHHNMGTLTRDEIREEEGMPALTDQQRQEIDASANPSGQ